MMQPPVTYAADPVVDGHDVPPAHFELEVARCHDLVGPYGAFVASMAPPTTSMNAMPSAAWMLSGHHAPRARAASVVERSFDALADVSTEVWKRVALYSLLFLVFGNLLRCRGLAASTNLFVVALLGLGIAGLVACARRDS